MGAIRCGELIRCQKEEFPWPALPSLCFLLLSADEAADNISGERNAHSALSADNDIISRHRREGVGVGGKNIRNLMANAAIYKDAVHSVAGAGSVSECNDGSMVAIGAAPR